MIVPQQQMKEGDILKTFMTSASTTAEEVNLGTQLETFARCNQLQLRLDEKIDSNIVDIKRLHASFVNRSRPVLSRMEKLWGDIKTYYKHSVQIDIQNYELLKNCKRQLQFRYETIQPCIKRIKEEPMPSSSKRGRKPEKSTKRVRAKPEKKFAVKNVWEGSGMTRNGTKNGIVVDLKPSRLIKGEPIEPLYCLCQQGEAFGDMIACDMPNCKIEWYHMRCVNVESPPEDPDEKWFCPGCLRASA